MTLVCVALIAGGGPASAVTNATGWDAKQPFAGNIGTGANSTVNSVAVAPDGSIVVGGAFTFFNGAPANRLLRLNPDGTVDATFTGNVGLGANASVYSVAVAPDGSVVVGGAFGSFNGTRVDAMVRLNPDGALDTTFAGNIGTAANNVVESVAAAADGSVVVGGAFTSFNGTRANRLVRLNPDGTLDATFAGNIGTAANNFVESVAAAADGSVLVGGRFGSFNGTPANGLVRLNPDGALDTTFAGNIGTAANGAVYSVAVAEDGSVVVGGAFTSFNGTRADSLVRLNPDGALDTTFAGNIGTAANGTVNSVAVAVDGPIVVGGMFTSFNDTPANRLVQLVPTSLAIDPLGTQSSIQDTAVTVPVSAHTGSGDPAPISFSATGLPPGSSIDSSTGAISGAPTTPGTYTVTVAATRAPTLTSPLVADTTFSWIVHSASASAEHSTITAAPAHISTTEASTITVTLTDALGHPIRTGGDTVTLSTTLGNLTGVVDNGDGTYTAILTSAHAGIATIAFAVNAVEGTATTTVEVSKVLAPPAPAPGGENPGHPETIGSAGGGLAATGADLSRVVSALAASLVLAGAGILATRRGSRSRTGVR